MLKIVSEKPPIGLIPRFIFEEERLEEIEDAMDRYRAAGKKIPEEWIRERTEIRNSLHERKQSAPATDRIASYVRERARKKEKNRDKGWESLMGEVGAFYEAADEAVDRSNKVGKKRTGGILRSDCELKADKVIEKAREMMMQEDRYLEQQHFLFMAKSDKRKDQDYLEQIDHLEKDLKDAKNKADKAETEVYDLIVDVVNCEKKGG
jgi:hypothetical protein